MAETTHNILKGKNIVITGLQPWYTDIGSNCKSIARQLSLNNKVLYINQPLDRRTVLTQKNDVNVQKHLNIIKKKTANLTEVEPNLWNYYPPTIIESINWLPSTKLFSFFNKINNKRFARDIREAIGEMNFDEFILFCDNDIYRSFYLKEYLQPLQYVYYCRDKLSGFDYWKKHAPTIEPLHIAKSDLATANSIYLANYLRKYNNNTRYIGQGCDISLFDPEKAYSKPADMLQFTYPVIGYVGALSSFRIDPNIIRTIATTHKEWNIVLVGPEDNAFAENDLHGYPNIHFLGKKPIHELPSYIAAFDICINPQLINDITIGNYPLKIDEYLAMGKPTVATRTETMEIFKDYVYLANSPEDYPGLIEKALQENNMAVRQNRIDFARTHTWENSVAELSEAIIQTMENSTSRH